MADRARSAVPTLHSLASAALARTSPPPTLAAAEEYDRHGLNTAVWEPTAALWLRAGVAGLGVNQHTAAGLHQLIDGAVWQTGDVLGALERAHSQNQLVGKTMLLRLETERRGLRQAVLCFDDNTVAAVEWCDGVVQSVRLARTGLLYRSRRLWAGRAVWHAYDVKAVVTGFRLIR